MNGLPGYWDIIPQLDERLTEHGKTDGKTRAVLHFLLRKTWWKDKDAAGNTLPYGWVNRRFTGHDVIAAGTGFSESSVKRALWRLFDSDMISRVRRDEHDGRKSDDIFMTAICHLSEVPRPDVPYSSFWLEGSQTPSQEVT